MIAASLVVIIGLLASVCAVFPDEGITLTDSTTLRFPSVNDMLSGDGIGEPQLSPEELLALREQEMKMQEEQQFAEFFRTNPVRIHFPGDDISYLDPVFYDLRHAQTRPMRIVHFGDSQIEDDRVSCVLRAALQEKFGGGGNGLIPLQESIYSQTTSLGSAYAPTRYQIYGPKANRRDSSNLYGPMGNVSILDSTMHLTISSKKRNGAFTPSSYYSQISVLSRSTNAPLHLSVQGQSRTVAPSDSRLTLTTLPLRDSTTSCTLSLSGNADIYGIMLDDATGVGVDNIPMRGCSGTVFTAIDATQLRNYFALTNTRLIIMQFGGNSMPYLKDQNGINRYVDQLRRQIRHMRKLAPDACILWIGPSDMTTRINGKMQTYPLLRKVDEAICQMVCSEGCAYWSLFESMGGEGSMVRWANAQPALAGKDYTHFTRLGAQRAGELLTEAFLTAYNYFTFRMPEPTAEELAAPSDTIEVAPAPTPQIEL